MLQRCNGLNGKAEIARKNSVWAHEQIALVHKQNGTIVVGNRLTLSGVALVSMMKSSNLLLQEMKMQWHRYQSACTYPTGDVYFYNVPPGDYRIFAMEAPPVTHYIEPWSCGALEKPRWEDLKIYEKDSTLIHIVPAKTNELNLRLIRAR